MSPAGVHHTSCYDNSTYEHNHQISNFFYLKNLTNIKNTFLIKNIHKNELFNKPSLHFSLLFKRFCTT